MAGTVYPLHEPRRTDSEAERALHTRLRTELPDGWIAWHSYRFARTPRRDARGPADPSFLREIDFLLYVPERGLVAVEVKGGARYRVEDGHLRSAPGEPAEDPMGQLAGAISALQRELRGRIRYVPPIAPLVVFPDVPGYDAPTGGGYEGRTLTGGRLAYLHDELCAFADRVFDRPWHGSGDSVPELHTLYGERWVPTVRAQALREGRAHEVSSLDAHASALASAFELDGRMLVLGGPGSGKTVLARAAAHRFAEAGRSVRVVCYTRALAASLRRDGLDAVAVRDAMRDAVAAVDATFDAAGFERADAAAHEALVARAAHDPSIGLPPVDVLVIDEAQDLDPRDLSFLERGLRPGGSVLACADPGQRFLDQAELPARGFHVTLRLAESHRTPEPLLALAEALRSGARDGAEPGEPESPPADVFHHVRPGASVYGAVREELRRLEAAGYAPHEVAVLSLASVGRRLRPDDGAPPVPRLADATDADDSLVLDTALRFKGLERPWVLVVDLPPRWDARTRLRAFVALTRATVGVTVVGDWPQPEPPKARAPDAADPAGPGAVTNAVPSPDGGATPTRAP